jgi:hypothetical protein
MGIDANLAFHLATTVKRFNVGGALCTLGVQTLSSEAARVDDALAAGGMTGPRDVPLYARLGFDRVESIDVSDFEGCSQVFDLNTPGVPSHLYGRFDAVYNGGTLEHIFDTRTALRNVFELLTLGGVAVHVGPADGWLEHGFYQFSPTLLVDYYCANRFEMLEAYLIRDAGTPGRVIVYPYVPGAADEYRLPCPGRSLFYMTFRKERLSTWEAVPQQRYYAELHGQAAGVATASRLRYAPPFRLHDGVLVDSQLQIRSLPEPTPSEGFEWRVHIPEMADSSDGMGRRQSRLMLFEDGAPVGPPHAPHAAIRTLGAGRYSHWDQWLQFSPSRNDDARTHAYAYAMAPYDV